jgi:hypothetical protein
VPAGFVDGAGRDRRETRRCRHRVVVGDAVAEGGSRGRPPSVAERQVGMPRAAGVRPAPCRRTRGIGARTAPSAHDRGDAGANRSRKRSAGRLEWPMVNTSKAGGDVIRRHHAGFGRAHRCASATVGANRLHFHSSATMGH